MSYSYTTNVGDGVTSIFPFSFAGQDLGYLSVSNVNVFVAGVPVSFTIPSNDPNKVYLTAAPPVGAEVLIRRIMPKNVPYSDFARGNPFSQDTLNNTNLQQLYIVQEILDGYLPEGFFFRTNIDMGGYKFTNLGEGVDPSDSVNFGQLTVEHDKNEEQDGRLDIIEDAIATTTFVNYISQLFVSTVGGETTINTTAGAHAAAVYIQGIFQHKAAGAYGQTGGVVTLAEPLIKGQEVYLILGSDLPSDALYASLDSVGALTALVGDINTRLALVEANFASKGVNSDITSLTGLTTALSVTQGGTGGNTAALARAGIGAAASGSNSDITSLQTLTGGIKGLVTGAPAAVGLVGEEVSAITSSAVTLTTGTLANIVSLSLPAGDWEVDCNIQLINSSNVTSRSFGVNGTSAVLPPSWNERYSTTANLTAGTTNIAGVARRILLSTATTIYLVANIAFAGTCTANGHIRAKRVR